jgi:hypothetical protein
MLSTEEGGPMLYHGHRKAPDLHSLTLSLDTVDHFQCLKLHAQVDHLTLIMI